ncbi:c-type cytochrome biogenesis protein CcmF [Chromatiales bacterium (ex Bugula neritina AB1)]|nr:c-type cytochrome biogenesis protein CcmF [Chromatiales bacterium (ex Bugula neritina AB1)]
MIPEIGHFSLILSLCVAIALAVIPMVGSFTGTHSWMTMARPAMYMQGLLVAFSYATLTHSFLVHDFSVKYVASTSNLSLPLIYRISGVWGGHEGSLLLWLLILSVWGVAVAIFSRGIPLQMIARVLSVMGMISVGFLLFMLFTSNPFDRLLPAPVDGQSLNPLLQDFGLAIHPPMLYMGYVGFSVSFAFAIAALIGGRLDMAWARWMRPWTNIAWAFLTIGIALGSWWAYYELGWGGWWFWDPVENASFMPWLVGTALIHSLAATEKRGAFKAWTVLLAVSAFSLSLLGTFLVRSGVLTSVHAFANDPARGVFILGFLGAVVGSSLVLYAWRAPMLRSNSEFTVESRESGLLFNNVVMVVICASVLLGTLYPLVLDSMGIAKLSVGAPYFNAIFLPLFGAVGLMAGVGALSRWKRDSLKGILKRVRWAAVLSVVAGLTLPFAMGQFKIGAALGIGIALWVSLTTLQGVWERIRNRNNKLFALLTIPAGFWGMTLAHIGIAVFSVGVSLTSLYSIEKDLRLDPGETEEIAGYRFTFAGVEQVRGENYLAEEGVLNVELGDNNVARMAAQKRAYDGNSQMGVMTEAAIDAGFTRDLFFALGEELDQQGAWSMRIYYKPFVRWIWLGAFIMGIGGVIAVTDRRYRKIRVKHSALDAKAATGVAGS